MLKFKNEVRIRYFNQNVSEILEAASFWSLINGVDVEVNSVDDGVHGPNTLHGNSLAVDVDTDGDKAVHLESLYQYLRRNLRSGYDVIHERSHVHCEWDVKRTESRLS